MGVEEGLPLLHKTQNNKKLRRFYAKQNDLLEAYRLDDLAIERGEPADENGEDTTHGDNILSKVVLVLNVVLLVGKATATYLTNGSSLSIISTLLDSVVDITRSVCRKVFLTLLSGLVIWSTTYAIMHTDFMKYPRGRDSLEGISIIFIGIVMGMANFFIIFQSVSSIIASSAAPDITLVSMIIMASTIAIKGILWVLCVKRGTTNSLVLAIDQRNDVFTNFVAILGAVLSQYWFTEADPIAAILISGYVAYSWIIVVVEQMPELTGVKCTDNEFSRVARVLIFHSEKIKCLDTLLIYHAGHKVRVEAHVVLPPDMKSKEVHDKIVDPLQRKLRCLDFVERAFVHPDYECDGYD